MPTGATEYAPVRMSSWRFGTTFALVLSAAPTVARADDAALKSRAFEVPPQEADGAQDRDRDRVAEREALAVPRGPLPYVRALGTVLGGAGLRFNNPYRLSTVLGSDAQSLSRTASYLDLGLAVLFGLPSGFQSGPALRVTRSLEGVAQEVLTPSYVVCRQWQALQPCARVGLPLLLSPDVNVGAELGLGVTYFVRAGIGITAETVGSLYYGAGTREANYPAYPVLSFQAGLVLSYEVLP